MPIAFSKARWDTLRRTYRRWWARELGRPIVQVHVTGRDPGRREPALPGGKRTAYYGDTVAAEDIVDRWDYDLSGREFLGDAFPCCWPDFGPGAAAVFMGARPQVDQNTVWFHPPDDSAISEIHLAFDPGDPWVRRIGEIMAAAQRRWGGLVQVSMTDLGGNLDLVSTFRPGTKLLLDLYDAPREVERLAWEAHEGWWRAFEHFNRILRPANPGYSAWAGIYCPVPYYMLQCDFAYMIGPEMFERFVKPELRETCRRLGRAFYHLDGIGQLAHLDSLLEIEELDGVQWVPGDGQPPCGDWPEVYERIRRAGKLVQFLGGLEELDRVADRLGTLEGFLARQVFPPDRRDEALGRLERFGVV